MLIATTPIRPNIFYRFWWRPEPHEETPAGVCLFRRFAYGVLSLAAYRWE